MNSEFVNLYSKDPRAVMMTIPEAESFLQGAIYYGPVTGADSRLYEKQGKFFRVTLPCLACLGLTQYDRTSPVVEVLEMELSDESLSGYETE